MGRMRWLAILVALLALGAWWALRWTPEPEQRPSVAALAPASDPVPIELARAEREEALVPAEGRRNTPLDPSGEEASIPSSAAGLHRYELEILVRDAFDRPVEGAQVLLAPRAHVLDEAGRSDADGRLVLRFEARVPRMQLALHARHVARASAGLRRIELEAGARSLALALRGPDTPESGLPPLPVERGWPAQAPLVAVGPAGLLRFREPLELEPARTEVHLLVQLRALGYVGDDDASDPDAARTAATLMGRVTDERGGAVPGALVSARSPGMVEQRAASDESGEWRIEDLAPGRWTLVAGGGELGLAGAEIQLEARAEATWNAVLERGLELRATLRDEQGGALAGRFVELESIFPAPPFADTTRSRKDGSFAVPNLPPHPLRILVARPRGLLELGEARFLSPEQIERFLGSHRLPVRVIEPVLPTLAPHEPQLFAEPELAAASLEVLVQDPAGEPATDVELRLWQIASGRGAWLLPLDRTGRYALRDVPPGAYELEFRAPHHAWRSEAVHLAPGARARLGPLRLEPPGTLALSAPHARPRSPPLTLTLDRELPELDSRLLAARPLAPTELLELRLPAGRYHATLARGAESITHTVELAPGERVEIDAEL